MLSFMLIILYAYYGGVIWRLRGGAFTTLTGINLGTDPDRVLFSILFGFPLCFFNPVIAAIVILGIFVALLIDGWGPFQSMGTKYPGIPEMSWLRWLPLKLGFAIDTVGHDIIGLVECGILLVLPIFLGLLVIGVHAWILFFMALFMPISYLIPRFNKLPTIAKFVGGQSWGEIFTGILLAMLIAFLVL
jgi:hypothetical protein